MHDDPAILRFSIQCQHRVVNWLKRQNEVSVQETSILDIGCGNGALLIELVRTEDSRKDHKMCDDACAMYNLHVTLLIKLNMSRMQDHPYYCTVSYYFKADYSLLQ